MRCHEVRDILSGILDGQEQILGAPAMEHVRSCSECARWHEEVEAAHKALRASMAAVPSIDLSATIMAALPAHHPASCKITPAFTGRKLAVLMAACWLLGAITMAAGIGLWINYGSSSHAVTEGAKASAGAAGSLAKSVWETGGVLVSVCANAGLGTLLKESRGILAFLIIDTLVLVVAAIIWRKRRALAGPFCFLMQSLGGI